MTSIATDRLGRFTRSALPDIVVIGVLVTIVAVPVWPGVRTVDSQALLRSAEEGQISNWFSPIHGWLWGKTDQFGVPPGFVLVMTTATLTIGLVATHRLWSVERGRSWSRPEPSSGRRRTECSVGSAGTTGT